MYLIAMLPQKTLFAGPVASITLPGSVAPFQILRGHIPLVSTLVKGTLKYHPIQGEAVTIPIQGGVAKVKENKITLWLYEALS